MSCEQERSLVLGIFISGIVQLRLGLTGPMKENWTQEPLDVILLGILSIFGVSSFMISVRDHFFGLKMPDSLRMLSLRGKIT